MSEDAATVLLDSLRAVLAEVAEPAQVLKTILGQAVSQTGADRGVFVEVSGSGTMSYRVLYKFDRSALAGEAGRFSRNILTQARETGLCVRIENALGDPQLMSKESVQELKLTSVLCVPIHAEGRVAALVHLEGDRAGHFGENHEDLIRGLASVASPALAALRATEGVIRQRDEARRVASHMREELEESREFLAREWSFHRFVGRAPAVRELEVTTLQAARTQFPVLLLGETGTGKSIVAGVLHHTGTRAKQKLVTVFCPSLERGMVETELFGHKRGAFTHAVADQAGKVQAADKGTLFLDEIGELPLEIQPKLLRLLQEKTYERVGDPTERKADVRVIAATNRDLEREVAAGRFRRDLFERLNFLPIRVPPLRERREDVPLLLRHCLQQSDAGRWITLTDEAADFLTGLDFAWPGNVRTLEQLAARLEVSGQSEPVRPDDLRRLLGATHAAEAAAVDGADLEQGLPAVMKKEERRWLERALADYPDYTRAQLAEKLKIAEATLFKKLREHGLGSSSS